MLPLMNSPEDFQSHQKVNLVQFAVSVMYIHEFAETSHEVALTLIIACLAFLGPTIRNFIQVYGPGSVYDLDQESLVDLTTAVVMCFLALLMFLPSLLFKRNGDQENAQEVSEESATILGSVQESEIGATTSPRALLKHA